jgi:hypothetical protein
MTVQLAKRQRVEIRMVGRTDATDVYRWAFVKCRNRSLRAIALELRRGVAVAGATA